MNDLRKLSLDLKDPQIKLQSHGQDKLLHKKLRELNTWIDKEVRPIADKTQTIDSRAKYSGGIVFPFK